MCKNKWNPERKINTIKKLISEDKVVSDGILIEIAIEIWPEDLHHSV